jgi:hypothetical protein
MPATISNRATLPAAPAHQPDDHFFDRVVEDVHRREARAQRAEQLTGQPFTYTLSSTSRITGLPLSSLRRQCRDGEIRAIKLSGCWMIHRDDFVRLLDPAETWHWHPNTAWGVAFLERLQRLAALLYQVFAPPTIRVLISAIKFAVWARKDGAPFEEAEGFAWRRAEWRVRYQLENRSRMDEALQLLGEIIAIGMELF